MRAIVVVLIFVSLLLFVSCQRKDYSGIGEREVENRPAAVSDSGSQKASLDKIKPEFRSLVEFFQKLLEKKRSDRLFYAEYEYSLSLRPSIAAGKRKKVFIQSKDSYYSDEKAENFQSTILIRDGQFYWKYSDTTYGAYYFMGLVDLGSHSGEEFLSSRGFVHNSYGDLDDELVSVVEEILKRGSLTQSSDREGVRTTIVSYTEYGNLEFKAGPSSISVIRMEGKKDTDRTVLSYNFSNNLPEKWQDPRPALLAEFDKPSPDAKINQLRGQITWDAIFDEYFAQLTQVRNLGIKEAIETARKFGYLYPTKNPEIVKSAQTYFGQLSLSIEIGRRKYMFHQFPPGNIDFSPVERFTKRKRNVKGFEVLEVVIDHLNWRQVYYVKREKKQALIFDDPVDFNDEKLDSLVESFTVISGSKKVP